MHRYSNIHTHGQTNTQTYVHIETNKQIASKRANERVQTHRHLQWEFSMLKLKYTELKVEANVILHSASQRWTVTGRRYEQQTNQRTNERTKRRRKRERIAKKSCIAIFAGQRLQLAASRFGGRGKSKEWARRRRAGE